MPINKGDSLGLDVNIGIHRVKIHDDMPALTQINPYEWREVQGTRATTNYNPGDPIYKGGFS